MAREVRVAAGFAVTAVLHACAAAGAWAMGATAFAVLLAVVGATAAVTAVLLLAGSSHAGTAAVATKVCWDGAGLVLIAMVVFGTWHNSFLKDTVRFVLTALFLLAAAVTARRATRALSVQEQQA